MAITFRSIDELPDVLQEYLYSDAVTNSVQDVFATNGIEDRAIQDAVLTALWAVFYGTVSLERLPQRIGEVLGKSPEGAYPLVAELAARVLLPAREFLGPVEAYIRRWDEQAATKTYTSVGESFTLPAYSRDELISNIVAVRPPTITHPRAVANFEKLAEEIVYRGRSNFEETQYLSELVGSIDGSGVGMAAPVAESTLLTIKQILAGSSIAKTPSAQSVPRGAARKQAAVEDVTMAQEVAAHAKQLEAVGGSGDDSTFVDSLTAAVLEQFNTVSAAAIRSAVDARVRMVRDTAATMEFLMRSVAQGGVGVDAETAMRIIAIVEEQVSARERIRHTAVVSAPAAPAPRGVAARPVERPVALTPPPRPVTAEKPRVEDVRRVIAPTGPIQEIASMRLTDFRRSSQDPMERVKKILGAIDRIGEEAYDEKIQAIQAWRYSEPYQLFENMMVDALANRKPLSVLVQERVRDRQPVLEEKEVAAMLHMHRMMENW